MASNIDIPCVDSTPRHFIARACDGREQLLRDHLQGVARLARGHAAKVGLGSMGELVGLVHDLGKYSAAFQRYIRSATGLVEPDEDGYVNATALKGRIDHSTAGAQLIMRELAQPDGKSQLLAKILAITVASHHSGLIDCLSANPQTAPFDNFARRVAKDEEASHCDEALHSADTEVLTRARELLASKMLMDELETVCRRVFTNVAASGLEKELHVGLLVRLVFSCLIDADRRDSADFETQRLTVEARTSWEELIARLDAHRERLPSDGAVNRVRWRVSDDCLRAATRPRGVYTLTVPTGGGKTLASLRYAMQHAREHGLDRVIYVIPFTSIIDQNAAVAREILEPAADRDRVVLEHHSNLEPSVQTWRHKISAESWDVPIVFTTMVQFLDTLFSGGTRGARRMHQLTRAVLIFDEIQTLPVRCVHLFNGALNFLVEQCGSSAVLCTATQPLLDRVDAKKAAMRLARESEIICDVPTLFGQLRRVEVRDSRRAEEWTPEQVAELALSQVAEHGSCLVIVNTKAAARAVFAGLKGADTESMHLSTSMCPAHRKAALKKVREGLAAGRPIVCVSTQLIEAGVDVDFGSVIRSLAGLDSIAQAAGRCNRNGKRECGVVHLVNLNEKLDMLPDIAIGRAKTLRVLSDWARKGDLLAPNVMAEYYQYYFFDRAGEMDYPLAADVTGQTDTLLQLLASNSLVAGAYWQEHKRRPSGALWQSFQTAGSAFAAIDAPTRGVLVCYSDEGRELLARLSSVTDIAVEAALLRRAQQYTVNVFPHELDKLKRAGALHPVRTDSEILVVDERFYGEAFGLSVEPITSGGLLHA